MLFKSKHINLRTKLATFKYRGIALDVHLLCRFNFSIHPVRRTITSDRPLHVTVDMMSDEALHEGKSASPQHGGKIADIDIARMRMPYRDAKDAFLENDLVAREPFAQFKHWFDEACKHPQIREPNAMALATCSRDGKPSCRMVLLKGFGPHGFRFFTNYDSRKGREIAENPFVSLMIYWEAPNRQVRIEGIIEVLSEQESAEYFHSRPISSQVAACVSHQSSVVPSRTFLADRAEQLYMEAHNQSLPKPAFWGGFTVIPEVIEFWQGQTNRLHDRIRFRRLAHAEKIDPTLTHMGDDGWVFERLAP
ncbi:pyridoxine/pyridoxamine 5'-phosphate oxidase-like [Paramacrobiotus metropolitanus]|uniref:pyridoxine/pyridoxamine 5'-phosphate oxidase-like n=1 Tax=Paramacrobiotus metropolitanus TaxID=2943436 RepID=UPI002445FE4E|nr:pyridoxine/pyridoxamine 5'-phosphate oxidase-like [Paramacrobiotus metropolitanus]